METLPSEESFEPVVIKCVGCENDFPLTPETSKLHLYPYANCHWIFVSCPTDRCNRVYRLFVTPGEDLSRWEYLMNDAQYHYRVEGFIRRQYHKVYNQDIEELTHKLTPEEERQVRILHNGLERDIWEAEDFGWMY